MIYDYLVIGSGFGGSVASLRLAEKGYTVLTIEQGKRYNPEDFPKTKALIKADPKMMHRILEILTDAVAQYLTRQFAAGADAIQIFDSWAGALTGADYEEFSLRYIRAVLERLPAGAPVILYAKGKSPQAAALAQTGVPCLGVDWTMPLSQVRQLAGRPICLQVNLDPEFMTGEPAAASAAT